jgi:hypothetical protein
MSLSQTMDMYNFPAGHPINQESRDMHLLDCNYLEHDNIITRCARVNREIEMLPSDETTCWNSLAHAASPFLYTHAKHFLKALLLQPIQIHTRNQIRAIDILLENHLEWVAL